MLQIETLLSQVNGQAQTDGPREKAKKVTWLVIILLFLLGEESRILRSPALL